MHTYIKVNVSILTHQIYMHAFKHESTNMHTYAHKTEYMCDFMYEHVSSIQTHHTLMDIQSKHSVCMNVCIEGITNVHTDKISIHNINSPALVPSLVPAKDTHQ